VGTHRLELRKEGYEPYPATLVVKAGETARLSAALAEVKPTATPEPPKDVVDPNRIYQASEVDLPPKRVGGPISPYYPDGAPKLKSGEKVSVGVSWVVTENGEITDITVTQSAGKAVDDAVMKMLRSQRWEPGAKKGTKVKVRLEGIYSFRSG
jgi:TonB family protein